MENILLKKKQKKTKQMNKQKPPNLAGYIQRNYSFGKDIARFLACTVRVMITKRLSKV